MQYKHGSTLSSFFHPSRCRAATHFALHSLRNGKAHSRILASFQFFFAFHSLHCLQLRTHYCIPFMFSLHFWHLSPRPFTEWVMHHTTAEITYELSKIKATELSDFSLPFFLCISHPLRFALTDSSLSILNDVWTLSFLPFYLLLLLLFSTTHFSSAMNCVSIDFAPFFLPFLFSFLCRLIPPFGFCVTSLIFARLNSFDARFSLIKLPQTRSIGSFFSSLGEFSGSLTALSRIAKLFHLLSRLRTWRDADGGKT